MSAGLAALLLAPLAAVTAVAPVAHADTCGAGWPTFGHDLGRSFAAPDGCSTINATNVATLTPTWFFNTGAPVTAQPVVSNGVVYVGADDGTFYALDATTGNKKWTFTVNDPNTTDFGRIPDSATVTTVGGTKVVVFAGVATLYVLNAADGTMLAARCFDPHHLAGDGATSFVDGSRPPDSPDPCGGTVDHPAPPNPSGKPVEIESSPAVIVHGTSAQVVVGMDYNESQDMGPAGLVSLSLVKDQGGKWHLDPKWKFDPETDTTYASGGGINPLTYHDGLADADGDGHVDGYGLGCGNVWSSPAIDLSTGLAVFGVGNCSQNSRTEAIVGVHLATGAEAFRFSPRQPSGSDPDTDFGATPNVLAPGLYGEGGKDGHYYAVDSNGASPWNGAAALASDVGGIIGSTAVGTSNSKPAVFASSAIPVSSADTSGSLQAMQRPLQAGGLHAVYTGPTIPAAVPTVTPDTTPGTVLWDAAAPPAYGAAVYVGGVVFLPDTFSFSMQAYDADTGTLLWSVPVGSAPASPPAVVGSAVYFGSGIPQAGTPLSSIGGVWAYSLPLSG